MGFVGLKKLNRFFARAGDGRLKTAVRKSVFDHRLNEPVILDDQNRNSITHVTFSPAASLQSCGGVSEWGRQQFREMLKGAVRS